MRVHFELKFGSDNVEEAREEAYRKVAGFMQVTEEAVPALVDLELKVAIPDSEKDSGIDSDFVITAFGNVKHSIAKPF